MIRPRSKRDREHCRTKTRERYRKEDLRIVDHIEAAWNEYQEKMA